MDFSSAAVRALGARLVTPELLLYPVRHHSPACAWPLQRWLAEHKPCKVLVEGPRSFDALLPLLTHPEARLPLAIYSYAVFPGEGNAPPRRRAAYYPFCAHSPEWVALQAAARLGVPAQFIDLDHAEQCPFDEDTDTGESHSLQDERRWRRSATLSRLAAQLGCRDHEELWEHLFEAPAAARSLPEQVGALAAYCQLARQDCSEAELQADGTLAREAEMAFHIRAALAARQPGDGPVLVVLGGFHAVVMPDLLDRAPNRPRLANDASEQASALIRYSQDRLDRLNGYTAGMTSPAWQQRVWDALQRGVLNPQRQRQEIALTTLFDIAAELRTRHGVALPMPALAAAYEQVLRLSELRGRAAPVREDVLDAVTSCFVKGDADADGALVMAVALRQLCGQALGQVPPGASTPPLVRDFAYRARKQRLKIDDGAPHRLVLDLYRRAEHRLTSRLLHGLQLLGVPLATRSAGPDFVQGQGLNRLQEHWDYHHTAATEAALVEASVFGATVPLAVAAKFTDLLAQQAVNADALAAARRLVQACVLGLHDHLERLAAQLAEAIGADAGFASVARAVGVLGLLLEAREPLEARGIAALPRLLQSGYERALYLGQSLAGETEAPDAMQALQRLRELLASTAGEALDASLFWDLLHTLRQQHDAALLRGAATGLLYGGGRLDDAQLAAALHGHLNGLLAPREAVAFLRGLLHTAREAAWQQPALLAVLDGRLREWLEADFIALLPELRLAFAEMTPKETDRIAQAVAALHGEAVLDLTTQRGLSAVQVQANLAISQRLTALLQADGLQDWVTP